MADDLAGLGVAAAATAVRDGRIGAVELVDACLERIDRLEPGIHAWVHLDPELARKQAREADAQRGRGRATGPLHGVPIAVKDIFDTADLPTENGTALHAGRRPLEDSAVVARLRQAGAVILGKTVTTEFAAFHPGPTTNPHDARRTPGGSSSGSAAAVAAYMAPGAIGSQTNGSMIRPASFCGIYGYKPSHGLVSRHGMLNMSRALDHVGVFGRSLADVAALAEPLMGHDERDPDTRPFANPGLSRLLETDPPIAPRLAFVRTPVWDQASEDVVGGLAELIEVLGDRAAWTELPSVAAQAWEWHRSIVCADVAVNLERDHKRGADRMSPRLIEMIDHGRKVTAFDYKRAIAGAAALRLMLDEIFADADAIVTPATTGEAPEGLESTGDPAFCTLWSLLGLPAVSLPLLSGANGMPIGVQLVGRLRDDARLFRTARWIVERVDAATGQHGGRA